MKDLDPKLTFETFVVGPANRLASAAARRAADSPGRSYNPLFVYAASGLGKSHLLLAIAHHGEKADPPLKVRYETLEEYLEALAHALEEGSREDLRDRYRGLDVLLLDDVQFLAGQPEAQELLLGTLDSLTSAGGQIVLASDRPPADIDGLDARLVSRFSAGLMVDIAPPEYETRVAILRRKAEERGQSLAEGVAEAIARYPIANVRELGGALNRILAVQDLEGRTVEASDVPGFMGDRARPKEPKAGLDGFDDFLSAVAGAVAQAVEGGEKGIGGAKEAPWRKAYREAAEGAERKGFVARRLRTALESHKEPSAWQARVESFHQDLARLQEIDDALSRLRNPWPEAAASVVKDPDRVEEAEALLASVRERVRPFKEVSPGPLLHALEDQLPALPLRAAVQLASAERPEYNPLFLWEREGSAARGLLASTARAFRSANPEGRMAVVSVADFAQDFIRALSEGVAGAWRERWWTVDFLLVFGVEDLSETERAQDEFFHLFEALKRRGARVLLAADRPPSEIGRIDERLRSRFEGGLVVEVDGRHLGPDAREFKLVDPMPVSEGDPLWQDLSLEFDGPVTGGARSTPRPSGTSPSSRPAPGAGELFEAAGDGSSVATDELPPRPDPLFEGPWRPSPERVVQRWPHADDRLVEDL